MRRFLSIAVLLLAISQYSTAQKSPSCCQASSIQAFTDLANDMAFVIAHEEPLPFTLENPKGENISFPVKGEDAGKAYYIKGKKSSKKWIFVFQEWWGLNDYIRMQADKLHESFPNHHILALDLYDGKVATTREEAGALMQSAKSERIEKLIAAAAEYSGKKSKIGTIGWCFGGAWSNKAAVLLKDKVAACVMYYGMPVKDDAQIAQIKAPVLGIFANKDGWITPKVVQEFKEKMVKNGKSIETFGYEAEHAFANPSNPKYHKAYSDEAWSKSISFFKVNL